MLDSLIAFLATPLQALMDLIQSGYQFILDFFYKDIYPFVTKFIAEMIKASIIASIEFKITALKFAWDIAKDLLVSLNISPLISAAWSALDSKVLQFLVFFRIPEGVNLLISAYTTKFVYRYIGLG